jgi:hypothetical protein
MTEAGIAAGAGSAACGLLQDCAEASKCPNPLPALETKYAATVLFVHVPWKARYPVEPLQRVPDSDSMNVPLPGMLLPMAIDPPTSLRPGSRIVTGSAWEP